MSKWLLVGLAACVPLWSGEHESPAPIALYLDFQNQPSADVLEALQEEVEVIMAPMGAEFEWRSLKAVTGTEVSAQLAVVKFLGRCETIGGIGTHPLKAGALGWTHVSEGTILPFSDIDCDGIRQFIRAGLAGVEGKLRPEAYGRAVGRVLAHELYHIFANTVHHGSNGVGKAVYSVQDLLSPDFQFEAHESDALRSKGSRPVGELVDATH
jgi:hypothetical protein